MEIQNMMRARKKMRIGSGFPRVIPVMLMKHSLPGCEILAVQKGVPRNGGSGDSGS
jgi:hypothetical protein